jgi:hypothetical protein
VQLAAALRRRSARSKRRNQNNIFPIIHNSCKVLIINNLHHPALVIACL